MRKQPKEDPHHYFQTKNLRIPLKQQIRRKHHVLKVQHHVLKVYAKRRAMRKMPLKNVRSAPQRPLGGCPRTHSVKSLAQYIVCRVPNKHYMLCSSFEKFSSRTTS